MTPGNKLKLRYGLVGAAVLIALLILFAALSGCAVGKAGDGSDVVGFRLGDEAVIGAASSIGGALGGIFGGPGGAALGASLAGAIATGIWGVRRGERRGWDEAVETVAGKPAAIPNGGVGVGGGAAAGGVPASRVGPVA